MVININTLMIIDNVFYKWTKNIDNDILIDI